MDYYRRSFDHQEEAIILHSQLHYTDYRFDIGLFSFLTNLNIQED